MDDPIRKMAEDIVDTHNINDSEIREDMIKEVSVAITKHINAELIARLDDSQVKEFIDLLDKKPDDKQIVEFVQKCGVDINEAVSSALEQFKDSYFKE
jgi:hypothetical protein